MRQTLRDLVGTIAILQREHDRLIPLALEGPPHLGPLRTRQLKFNNCSIGPMFGAFDTTSQDVLMTVFPAFGRVSFAWIAAGLAFGARNVRTDLHPAETLRRIESERVTLMNLIPTKGAMMLAEPSLPSRNLRSLRGLVFAGAIFPAR